MISSCRVKLIQRTLLRTAIQAFRHLPLTVCMHCFPHRTRTLQTQHNLNQLSWKARSDLHSWMERRRAFMDAQSQSQQRMRVSYVHTLCVFKLSLYSEIWLFHGRVGEDTMPCRWVNGSRRLKGKSCLHLPSDDRRIPEDLNCYPYIFVTIYKSCQIWGSRSGPDKQWILLDCFAVLTDKLFYCQLTQRNTRECKHYSRKYHEREWQSNMKIEWKKNERGND
jgi:hypothetical protein